MAMQETIVAAASSFSVSLKKYDVFMSFRGEDTRRSFASHLYEALSKNLVIFMDDPELEKGDEISSALIKAIEESYASIVIFSKDYASSKWCLNELVKILECKKDNGQIVIPIFYEIDPSHVRKQDGSYGQAFVKHERDLKHNKERLQKWKDALTEAANLAGWHSSQNYRVDTVFIRDIVEDVRKKLHRRHPFEVNKELVGIENKHKEIESLLKSWSNDVRILALWGMGGIGKTTLAKSLYAKHCSQFERHCFIRNVREESTRCGLDVVRKILISTLLDLRFDAPYVENPIFIRKLACERSLVVLDDVATSEQAENLNIVNDCLGPGSRVIVTTRDKQICNQFNECTIYEVEGLNEDYSLQLFCWNAFGKKHAKVGYEDLSESAISYCSGNPLALKVLGANFCTKSKEAWESELEKLKKIPNRRIHDVLKLSFDDLDRTQQDIFLDIACFSKSTLTYFDYICDPQYLIGLWSACSFFAVSGIEVLLNKALISFTRWDKIKMHDLVVEMGREIVNEESPKNPGRRSRLWDPEEVHDVLKYNKGTEVVEVILFNISKIGDLYLRSDCFKSMTNLRCLQITNNINNLKGCELYTVHLLEGLEWLSDKLRHLFWDSFPLESLPSTFCAEWLVQISMSHSKLRKLWDGIQRLDNLMIIDLSNSKDLIEIPDLSRAPNLQILSLSNCVSLCQIHPSIFTVPKLRELHLRGCKKIESLKTNIHSKSLESLNLSDCSSLVEFSVTSEEMTCLLLSRTAIHEFPSSMWWNRKLTYYLDLSECKELNIVGKKLSDDPGLESLTYLNLSGCTQISTLNMWFILDGMRSLIDLVLNECCNLEALPDNIQNCLMLEKLYSDECINLKSLPKLPASLQELRAINCTYLDIDSIQREMLENYDVHRLDDLDALSFRNISLLPGSQVPCEFAFQTTAASIDIPHIPKSGLCCFILCIILPKLLDLKDHNIICTIYEHGKGVRQYSLCHKTRASGCTKAPSYASGKNGILNSDHVMLGFFYSDVLVKEGNESGGDHSSLSFKFDTIDCSRSIYGGQWSTDGIKGCGVIPVYNLDGRRRSNNVEIVELASCDQVSDESDQHLKFDIDESQHRAIEAEGRDSTHGNEDDQQQLLILPEEKEEDLNDKSSCDCSVGLLLKHMLGESKRLFLLLSQAKLYLCNHWFS